MTADQKEHAIDLLLMGEKLEAVRYLQQTLNINAEQALILTEKLQEETDNDTTNELNDIEKEMRDPKHAKLPKIVGSIFMGLGLVMLSVTAYLLVDNYRFTQRAIKVTGKVIAYDSYFSHDDDGGSSTMYTPTYEYSFNGVIHTYQSNTSSSSRDFDIGETIEVLVDPNDPQSIIVNTFWERYLVSLIFGFIGTMFTGLGYMAYRIFG